MASIPEILESNRNWAASMEKQDRAFFEGLAKSQKPEYLWIGCSDSRVPANQILGLNPGEVFVHRNIANLVLHTDMNSQSVIQYAVEALEVKHIIVCGHYGCGGVQAALNGDTHGGVIDNWLNNIQDIYSKNKAEIEDLPEADRLSRLCEINTKQQVLNLAHSTVVRSAWKRGQELSIHGWIYSIKDGIIKELGIDLSSLEEAPLFT